jgi:predicted phosphodiesterase
LRVAVLSDPHGDWLALRKVLDDVDRQGPLDELLIGGDLAQGGAQPREVVDEIQGRGWRAVRGNGDELLVRIAGGASDREALEPGDAAHGGLPDGVAERARWSVEQLGPERIAYLRSLPLAAEVGSFSFGRVVLVHATPWSLEDVVLPDAPPDDLRRMIATSRARVLLYGHIHTPYQRRVDDAVVASVGAVSGSNDEDPRPAYTVVTIDDRVTIEVRRVDWPRAERVADYRRAGVAPEFIRDQPGPLPVSCTPGRPVVVWPWDAGAPPSPSPSH